MAQLYLVLFLSFSLFANNYGHSVCYTSRILYSILQIYIKLFHLITVNHQYWSKKLLGCSSIPQSRQDAELFLQAQDTKHPAYNPTNCSIISQCSIERREQLATKLRHSFHHIYWVIFLTIVYYTCFRAGKLWLQNTRISVPDIFFSCHIQLDGH